MELIKNHDAMKKIRAQVDIGFVTQTDLGSCDQRVLKKKKKRDRGKARKIKNL